jgi:CHC2 zinc finger
MPLLDLRQARADIGLTDVLALLGWTARARVGVQVRGPCPVHGAHAPRSRSFSAHLGKNCWQCFRCGAAGNALDLWVQVTRQQLYPALLDWYRRLGRPLPWLPAAQRRRS